MTKEEAYQFIGQSIKSDVDMAKIADALQVLEERKTSKWIDTKQINLFTYNHIFRCSLCGCEVEGNGDNYCKSCGAKMENGE